MYVFPFPVPEDLKALSAADFTAFLTQVREHASTVLSAEDSPAAALVATRDLWSNVKGEETRRAAELAAGTDARATLAADLAEPVIETPAAPATVETPAAPPAAPAPVVPATVAPVAPAAVVASTGTSTIDTPPAETATPAMVMVYGNDTNVVGNSVEDFTAAGRFIEERLGGYSTSTRKGARPRKRLNASGTKVLVDGRTMVRHGNIQFRRQFDDALRIVQGGPSPLTVLDHAIDQRRLDGGSLVEAMTRSVKSGKSLTAAVGWCAPSEILYDLCMLETRDGMLDLPEVQATRGGFQVPALGGPNFASIWDAIGDEGDVILSEYDVENGAEKVCTVIPCPDFVDVRMDVAYICLTGALLQRRGYPEAVTRFSQGAMIALDHKVNESVISRLAAQSVNAGSITPIADNDDAVSALLSAVELAIEDIKYRNRMGRSATIEIVLPAWVIAPLRAALARRRGVSEWNVSDSEILAAFTTRNAVPRFVYDWQDAFSNSVNGPGRATPITAFPTTVQFLAYPAGTWVKPVRDVVNLDTVYDNAMLTENQFTAVFAEDGFNVIQMCTDSRLYTASVDPAGIIGCCS